MLLLQASIGAVNDLADVELDRVGKPGKPLIDGSMDRCSARAWAVGSGVAGMLLVVPSGIPAVLLAAAGVSIGYAYDLGLSRTRWSWLLWGTALPLVPIFGWLAARGGVPQTLLALVPVAFLAGVALQLANGLVDVERDARAGRATVEVAAGRSRAWLANVVALTVAVGLAFLLAPTPGGPAAAGGLGVWLVLGRAAGVPVGAFAIAVGAGLLTAASPALRERGWELEAIGTALVGLGWVAGAALVAGGSVAAS